jgi:hyperosmotically inducible protein
MTKFLLSGVVVAVMAAGACKSKSDDRAASDRAADNTAQNARDKSVVPTADQAGQRKPDLDVAQQVRKAIMSDSSLSTNAHNCKVVVNDSVVTLAGPVASADERSKVEQLATSVAGVTKVVNQLEVAN